MTAKYDVLNDFLIGQTADIFSINFYAIQWQINFAKGLEDWLGI